MTNYDGDRATPDGNLGTPIYDELTGNNPAQREDTSTPATEPVSASFTIGAFAVSAAVLDLFGRLKRLDRGTGWNGGDVVETLNSWFAEFGIDVDVDEATAAQTLQAPAWLARSLKVPGPESPTVVVHVRTDHPEPVACVRRYMSSLIQDLGEHASIAIFGLEGDQVVSIMHGAASRDEP